MCGDNLLWKTTVKNYTCNPYWNEQLIGKTDSYESHWSILGKRQPFVMLKLFNQCVQTRQKEGTESVVWEKEFNLYVLFCQSCVLTFIFRPCDRYTHWTGVAVRLLPSVLGRWGVDYSYLLVYMFWFACRLAFLSITFSLVWLEGWRTSL